MPISDERLRETADLMQAFRVASFHNTTAVCNYNNESCFEDYGFVLEDSDMAGTDFCAGNTILINGIANSSVEFVEALLKLPFTTHLNTPAEKYVQCTPLTLCMSKGWNHSDKQRKPLQAIAMALVQKGANINLVDKKGRSALHYACLHRNKEAIQFLVENGAKTEIRDSQGYNPSDYLDFNFDQATQILTEACGGEAFTLEKKFFVPGYHITLPKKAADNKEPPAARIK